MSNSVNVQKGVEVLYDSLLRGSLISNLEKWIQYLDSAKRFGTSISGESVKELKALLEQSLERINEYERCDD